MASNIRVGARQPIKFNCDHLGIVYDIKDCAIDHCFKLSGKPKLATSVSITAGEWEEAYKDRRPRALALVERHCSTRAFNLLPKTAEKLLGLDPEDKGYDARADTRDKVARTQPVGATSKGGKGQDTAVLAQLQRLHRRRLELSKRGSTDDDGLHANYLRNARHLLTVFDTLELDLTI